MITSDRVQEQSRTNRRVIALIERVLYRWRHRLWHSSNQHYRSLTSFLIAIFSRFRENVECTVHDSGVVGGFGSALGTHTALFDELFEHTHIAFGGAHKAVRETAGLGRHLRQHERHQIVFTCGVEQCRHRLLGALQTAAGAAQIGRERVEQQQHFARSERRRRVRRRLARVAALGDARQHFGRLAWRQTGKDAHRTRLLVHVGLPRQFGILRTILNERLVERRRVAQLRFERVDALGHVAGTAHHCALCHVHFAAKVLAVLVARLASLDVVLGEHGVARLLAIAAVALHFRVVLAPQLLESVGQIVDARLGFGHCFVHGVRCLLHGGLGLFFHLLGRALDFSRRHRIGRHIGQHLLNLLHFGRLLLERGNLFFVHLAHVEHILTRHVGHRRTGRRHSSRHRRRRRRWHRRRARHRSSSSSSRLFGRLIRRQIRKVKHIDSVGVVLVKHIITHLTTQSTHSIHINLITTISLTIRFCCTQIFTFTLKTVLCCVAILANGRVLVLRVFRDAAKVGARARSWLGRGRLGRRTIGVARRRTWRALVRVAAAGRRRVRRRRRSCRLSRTRRRSRRRRRWHCRHTCSSRRCSGGSGDSRIDSGCQSRCCRSRRRRFSGRQRRRCCCCSSSGCCGWQSGCCWTRRELIHIIGIVRARIEHSRTTLLTCADRRRRVESGAGATLTHSVGVDQHTPSLVEALLRRLTRLAGTRVLGLCVANQRVAERRLRRPRRLALIDRIAVVAIEQIGTHVAARVEHVAWRQLIIGALLAVAARRRQLRRVLIDTVRGGVARVAALTHVSVHLPKVAVADHHVHARRRTGPRRLESIRFRAVFVVEQQLAVVVAVASILGQHRFARCIHTVVFGVAQLVLFVLETMLGAEIAVANVVVVFSGRAQHRVATDTLDIRIEITLAFRATIAIFTIITFIIPNILARINTIFKTITIR
mmetsp:Transcript_5390/g.8967  ORF Transcript_5390/g.8967 Transcript_5390/m.8967 type:complete len:938 (-) Transcript_5390:1105-3918(-)